MPPKMPAWQLALELLGDGGNKPHTPEMNSIEQTWKEIRKRGFRNEVFATLEKVVLRLCDTISSLPSSTISSITCRAWIIKVFY